MAILLRNVEDSATVTESYVRDPMGLSEAIEDASEISESLGRGWDVSISDAVELTEGPKNIKEGVATDAGVVGEVLSVVQLIPVADTLQVNEELTPNIVIQRSMADSVVIAESLSHVRLQRHAETGHIKIPLSVDGSGDPECEDADPECEDPFTLDD